MISSVRKIRNDVRYWWVLPVYGIFYCLIFMLLENRIHVSYTILQVPLDTIIPFCEYFIIPYELWFIYMAAASIYLLFVNRDAKDYYRYTASMIIGMSIFLFVSWIFPNMQVLRPHYFAHDNIFVHLVQGIYNADTPTNIFPSIHVYNSMAMYLALRNCRSLKGKKWINLGILALTVSIVLSTMFLKQHSTLDVVFALVLNFAVYETIYVPERTPVVELQLLRKKA